MIFYYPLATPRQQEVLYQILDRACWHRIPTMSKHDAHNIIAAHAANWRRYLPTSKQEWYLRKWGRWKPGLTRGEASDLIADLKARIARMTPEEIEAERQWAQPVDSWAPNEENPSGPLLQTQTAT